MGLLRRQTTQQLSPIAEFWLWWLKTGERAFSKAIATGQYGNLPNEISAKVRAIHPELEWETSKGVSSQHSLGVTAAGVAELRPLAERWLRAGPPASSTWEYSAARRRDPEVLSSVLEFAGVTVDLGLARFGIRIDTERQLIDVSVFHPAFLSLGDSSARQVTYLLLDWLLGEDDVERWIGGIETVLSEPKDAVPPDALLSEVVALAKRPVAPSWILAESTTSAGNRLLVTALRPLRWIDHPLLDLHTEIRLPFPYPREDGLPTSEALEMLREYEDGVARALGDRGLLVAIETFEGQRVFHLYSDSEDQNARDILDRFGGDDGATKTHTFDPSWKLVRPFR